LCNEIRVVVDIVIIIVFFRWETIHEALEIFSRCETRRDCSVEPASAQGKLWKGLEGRLTSIFAGRNLTSRF
jgi:hypothetical protein